MRLVCPNCGAQYEVDDRVMPETGRDVQCSACGHAWFQRGPAGPETAPEPDLIDMSPTAEDPATADSAADGAQDSDQTAEDTITAEDTSPSAPDNAPPASKRDMDPEVKSILQEEAQRELDARHSEQEQLETQTEMGLEDVDPDEAQRQSIRERMARLRGAEDEFETTDALPEGRGRDLLPDIEEINSTLDASHEDISETLAVTEAEDSASGGGFRRGFLIMVLLALALLGLYAYAPTLAEMLPAAKAPLDSYVILVDQLRDAINGVMRNAITAMQGMSGEG